MTPIHVGENAERGLLLGPLVVDPEYKGKGHGKALMRLAVEEARKAGCPFIILVGDQPYYWPFGFRPLPPGKVQMPGPVDPARLLVAELKPGAADGLQRDGAEARSPDKQEPRPQAGFLERSGRQCLSARCRGPSFPAGRRAR